jgi:hypothetical protein
MPIRLFSKLAACRCGGLLRSALARLGAISPINLRSTPKTDQNLKRLRVVSHGDTISQKEEIVIKGFRHKGLERFFNENGSMKFALSLIALRLCSR